jgi:hypothetical protein
MPFWRIARRLLPLPRETGDVGPVTYGTFSFDISDSESLLGRMVTLEVAQLVRN